MDFGELIIYIAQILGAAGVLLGAIWALFRFLERQKNQDMDIIDLHNKHNNDIKDIKDELQVLCYGVLSCLDGLKQQGCNGNVTKAHTTLEKHLNKAAHDE